jgi:hypothetical protein
MTLALLLALLAAQDGKGSVKGRISPEASVRIVAKLAQTDASKPENVKGEVKLPKGGEFEIAGLPPGTYDLLFELQGDDAKRFKAGRWSEVGVVAGKATEGISYRLTPADSDHMIDEVMLSFEDGVPAAAREKTVADLGCRVKHRGFKDAFVVVDIPDDKSVTEMIDAFRKVKGVKHAERNGISRIK